MIDGIVQQIGHWKTGSECWETSWGYWKLFILTLLTPKSRGNPLGQIQGFFLSSYPYNEYLLALKKNRQNNNNE